MFKKLIIVFRYHFLASFYLSIGYFLLLRRQNDIQNSDEFKLKTKWLTTITYSLLKRTLKKGNADIYLFHYSLPMSSEINTFPGLLYDAGLRKEWRESKIRIRQINDKQREKYSLNYSDLFIKYFADSLSRHGFLNYAFQLYKLISEKENTENRLIGNLGLLDIAILITQWNTQLEEYYKKRLWFNPDDISEDGDALTPLFKICNHDLIKHLYHKCINLVPKCVLAEIMYGEYFEKNNQTELALSHYNNASNYAPTNLICNIKRTNALLLSDKIQNNKDYILAELTQASKLCKQNSWNSSETGLSKELICNHKIYLNGRSFNRQSKLPSHNNKWYEFQNTWDIGSGVLMSDNDNGKHLILDSNHVSPSIMKMFTPSIIQFNKTHALIRENDQKHYYDFAFIIPGTGWNYYHWIIETIPLLKIYKEEGFNNYLPLYFPYALESWHRETLRLLGLHTAEILPFHARTRIFFKKLIMPEFSAKDLVPSHSNLEFIHKNLSRPKKTKKGKNIYLIRCPTNNSRKMSKEHQVRKLLKKNGFDFINPALMTITEQIDFFADVDILVAEGGASNCNLLFCPEKTHVIILSADRTMYDSISFIAGFIGQELTYILGKSHPSPSPYYLWTAYDFEADINSLSLCLDKLL